MAVPGFASCPWLCAISCLRDRRKRRRRHRKTQNRPARNAEDFKNLRRRHPVCQRIRRPQLTRVPQKLQPDRTPVLGLVQDRTGAIGGADVGYAGRVESINALRTDGRMRVQLLGVQFLPFLCGRHSVVHGLDLLCFRTKHIHACSGSQTPRNRLTTRKSAVIRVAFPITQQGRHS